MNLYNIQEIKNLLDRHGFRFSKSMGQNFLVASWVPEEMIRHSGIGSDTGVLEIGPGIGALTTCLSPKASKLVAVELDKRLLPLLAETLSGLNNVEVISGDILKLDLKALVQDKFGGLSPVVCANLPYNITTPVLSKLIDSRLFTTITVMVQREVARRICAEANSTDYGAFTVYMNYYTEPEILFDVPPSSFIPQPKVYSSVIRLKVREVPPVSTDEAFFFRVVRAAFAQRRKTLANCLSVLVGNRLSKNEIAEIISVCGFSPLVRGESLDIAGFSEISNVLRMRVVSGK